MFAVLQHSRRKNEIYVFMTMVKAERYEFEENWKHFGRKISAINNLLSKVLTLFTYKINCVFEESH